MANAVVEQRHLLFFADEFLAERGSEQIVHVAEVVRELVVGQTVEPCARPAIFARLIRRFGSAGHEVELR